jgi:hypothetical protein
VGVGGVQNGDDSEIVVVSLVIVCFRWETCRKSNFMKLHGCFHTE